jgi:hypothetical protein
MSRLTLSQVFARPSTAVGLYSIAAVLLTWPLASVATQQIAGDASDTLFNCWVLQWTSGQVMRALHGDLSALRHYWDGNIFYPSSLTLAYSNHLTPQMLQALPVLASTGNIVLAYNLLFLATIVLSGLGVYLLVRDVTGEPVAAFLGGLAFAFAPYRIDQYAHLEVLSSEWMPFALFGLRRFIVSGRLLPLAGGTAAVVAQAFSCGYYLAYFAPFVVAYCLCELALQNRLRDRGTWRALIAAGAIAVIVVGAFSWPYAEVRRRGDVGVRGRAEIEHFSADTHAFATVSSWSRLWGSRLRALPREEGAGFPGFAILCFGGVAVAASLRRAAAEAREVADDRRPWQRLLAVGLAIAIAVLVFLLGRVLITGSNAYSIAGVVIRHSALRLLSEIAVVVAILAVISPWFRRVMRGVRGSAVAFFAWAAFAAAWMSLGPSMYANTRAIGPGLYAVFYRSVPGFNGLRVPSLNFMLVALMLAVLAGLGAASLIRWRRKAGRRLAVAGMVLILAEGWSVAPTAVLPARGAVYDAIAASPEDTVVVEFPFGDPASEIDYTFFAGSHRKPIVNGYSGYFPAHYIALVAQLSHPPDAGSDAWDALASSGATHAIVHEGADVSGGRTTSEWLQRHGAREILLSGSDRLFQLR